MVKINLLKISVLIFVLLVACTPEPVILSTSTVTLLPSVTTTATSQPTTTPTLTSTKTKVPRATATQKITINQEKKELVSVPAAGFQFMKPFSYAIQIEGQQVLLANSDGSIFSTLIGTNFDPAQQTPQEFVDGFLERLFSRSGVEYTLGEETLERVADIAGSRWHVVSENADLEIEGDVVIVTPFDDQLFFLMVLAKGEPGNDIWQVEGLPLLDTLLPTIVFNGQLSAQSTQGCQVSKDPTFGYTKENAIRTGGDWMSGPARERAYLDNLRGPNGETVEYERIGSLDFGDTILDQFLVSYPGKQVTLYLDEYDFTDPMAPLGFTCPFEFPLSAP